MNSIVFALPLPGFAFQKTKYRKAFHHVTRFTGFPLRVWQGSGYSVSPSFIISLAQRLHNIWKELK
jgi:hypothetical protein